MPKALPRKSHLSREPLAVAIRPELAVQIAMIVTGWTRVEQILAQLFVQLLGSHARAGITMYLALSGSGSQFAVLRAIASDALSGELRDKLEAVLILYRKTAKRRNAVVHGLWDVSLEHPDALVWCSTDDELMDHSDYWAGLFACRAAEEQATYGLEWKPKRAKQSSKLLYTKADFEDIREAIREVLFALRDLHLECEKHLKRINW